MGGKEFSGNGNPHRIVRVESKTTPSVGVCVCIFTEITHSTIS